MFINIGNNNILFHNDIIGFFDIDNTTVSKNGRNFLNQNEALSNIVYATDDLPKSFCLCDDGKIFLSQLSSSTLCNRLDKFGR